MGTPNITGQYQGAYNIVVRSTTGDAPGTVQAFSSAGEDALSQTTWTLDFDNGTITIENGRLTPRSDIVPLPIIDYFNYEAWKDNLKDSNVLSLSDNNDGTYTVLYYWRVIPNGDDSLPFPPPETGTNITLEITQLKDGSLAVVTVIGSNGIPGTPLPTPPFLLGASPDWRGRAVPA